MENIYDLAGIGIGPFNLGLAALSQPIQSLKTIFFDEKPVFNWHPGLLLENTTLQVAFYADLVTLADPSSRFSFFSYLKAKGRLIPFGILENNYITRREYNHYCKWVVKQLDNLYFGHRVDAVYYDKAHHCYQLKVRQVDTNCIKTFYAKRLVIGIGSVPRIPDCVKDMNNDYIFHSGDYLYHKQYVLQRKSVTIIGSGQSAAEIFDDLLNHECKLTNGLCWFTRSPRFYPMDYSKLTLEMSTPDYIDYFYSLSDERKEFALCRQNMLYKGINYDLINGIYGRLYHLTLEKNNLPVRLLTHCELKAVKQKKKGVFQLTFFHKEMEKCFTYNTEIVIMATGYHYQVPSFIDPVREHINWDKKGRYQVKRNYSIDKSGNEIFVQNAELHTHGFNAADLSLGPYRNAIILNEILGYEYYIMEKKNAFQHFGIP